MRPRDLVKQLALILGAGMPVMMKGAPGIGKTDLGHQVAAMLEADLLVTHPVVSDPTDFKGLPGLIKGKAEFLPFGDLRQMLEATRRTIVMIDDIGQAPLVVQAAVMQLILARRINGHAVSEHVTFLACTNRREDRAGVTAILEPVKSRFATILELTVDVDDWCEWALDNDMPTELIAFIRFRPDLLMATGTPTNDIVNRACPRTVANVGRLMSIGCRDFEVLEGAAGKGFATELLAFLKVWEAMPSIDGILLDPAGAEVPTDPAAMYAVVMALASRATATNGARIMKYARRLRKEYALLLARDAVRRCPEFTNNRDYIAWAVENQELLVGK